jgi:hypothetical protein
MRDRRSDSRFFTQDPDGDGQLHGEAAFEVHSTETGQPLGYVEDISAHGICLLTTEPLETRETMSITVKFPGTIANTIELVLHIRTLWSCQDDHTGLFRIGCHVIILPTTQTEIFETLLEHIAQRARAAMAKTLKQS